MSELSFYHQVRVDGGSRTGLESGDTELLQFFQSGDQDEDPRILWYVDIKCSGDRLPEKPSEAKEWFRRNSGYFSNLLEKIADQEINAGFDAGHRPFEQVTSQGPDNCRVCVRISAISRAVAREIAGEIRDAAQKWLEIVDRLEPLTYV